MLCEVARSSDWVNICARALNCLTFTFYVNFTSISSFKLPWKKKREKYLEFVFCGSRCLWLSLSPQKFRVKYRSAATAGISLLAQQSCKKSIDELIKYNEWCDNKTTHWNSTTNDDIGLHFSLSLSSFLLPFILSKLSQISHESAVAMKTGFSCLSFINKNIFSLFSAKLELRIENSNDIGFIYV